VTDRKESVDPSGNRRATVLLELLVDGGEPARVSLGRRAAWGFTPSPEKDGEIAGVASYTDAHGEYAEVTRPRPGELHVECYGQDEAYPDYAPPRTNVRTARVRIPADASIAVDETIVDDTAPR
jgi:hypothetical protein